MNSKLLFIISLYFWLITSLEISQAASSPIRIHVQEARNYGYSLGDEIKLLVDIETPAFTKLETGFLPKPGPVNNWLVLKRISIEDSPIEHDYRLDMTFQVFKDVRKTTQLSIPALPLRFRQGGEYLRTIIPAWFFTYNPLIPENTGADQIQIQPALAAKNMLPGKHGRIVNYLFIIISASCIYLAWFYGKIPFLERYSGPFGKACKTMKELNKQAYSKQHYAQALRCFHKAINDTAGETVFLQRLPEFFTNFPAYQSMCEPTEQLFNISQQYFFAGAPGDKETISIKQIETLCQLYRKIERGSKWS